MVAVYGYSEKRKTAINEPESFLLGSGGINSKLFTHD